MLKQYLQRKKFHFAPQPPLGGCVLKLQYLGRLFLAFLPAAFRRLCVETRAEMWIVAGVAQPPLGGCVLKQDVTGCDLNWLLPAAFRRLCVETNQFSIKLISAKTQPPLGGCVLKLQSGHRTESGGPSRL